MNKNEELLQSVLDHVGGQDNVLSVENCMTRLRLRLADGKHTDDAALKQLPGVLGIVHEESDYIEVVVGPGVCRQLSDLYKEKYGSLAKATGDNSSETAPGDRNDKAQSNPKLRTDNDWRSNKEAIKARTKEGKVKGLLKTFGKIFIPLIPGVITAGLCSGFATLLAQLVPDYADSTLWGNVHAFLSLINMAFMTYITAWAGYRAAEEFGATPILGGMLGMITTLDGINTISGLTGLFNEASPLDSVLRAGRGGVLAAVVGVYLLSKVEKSVRKIVPGALDIVVTPLITLIVIVIPYVYLIMPATGLISTGLVWVVEQVCMSDILLVRVIAGFLSATLFLPMVAVGMHHGLVALYTVQLNTIGFVTLYPALAMAGAGQVGAAIAIYLKAKKVGNQRIRSVISGALPAGFLGVGEPLIYGVTLPLGKPFITAGIGAGFGGAFAMAMQVASTTWGPSGILACFVMTAGPNPPLTTVLYYVISLVISYIGGFVVTNLFVKPEEISET